MSESLKSEGAGPGNTADENVPGVGEARGRGQQMLNSGGGCSVGVGERKGLYSTIRLGQGDMLA